MALSTGFGCYVRPPMDNTALLAGAQIDVSTDAELDAALATIAGSPLLEYHVELADGDYEAPRITGWNGTGQVTFYAANPGQVTFVEDGGDYAFRIDNTTRPVDMLGINVDGQGQANWTLVVGTAYQGDPNSGTVENFRFAFGEVMNAGQEPIRIAASSENILFEHFDVHGSGQGAQNDFGELVYIGQGGDNTDQPNNITLRGFHAYNGRFGEAVDIKIGARNVVVEDFLIEDIEARFAGAFAVGTDANDGGHGQATSHIIRRGHIENVRPSPNAFTQSIEGIEIGTDALIENVTIEDVSGRGLNLVDQFYGPNKTVIARHLTIVNTGNDTIDVNEEAPNGGNIGGTLVLENVLTDDGAHGSTQYVSGFVGSGNDGLDLMLVASSPHVGAGVPSATTEDRCGVARDASTPTIGAFEYATVVASVPPSPTVVSGDCTARGVTDSNGGFYIEVNGSTYFDMDGNFATPVLPVS